MPKTIKQTAVYVRVSTTSQNEEGQRQAIDRWLQGHGTDGQTVRWFVDVESGDTMDRAGFEALQQAVFNGEVGTIVVYKLDRISRKLADGITVLSDWLDKGIRFVAVTQQFDFSGALGKTIAALLFGVAEMEQETRRERQADGIRAAKAKGVYKGRKPGATKKGVQPRRAKKLKDKGLTIKEIATALGVSRPTVYRYLES